MVVAMASSSSNQLLKLKPTPASMNPLLLASSFFGSWRALSFLLDREDDEAVPTDQAFLDELLALLDNTSMAMAKPQQASNEVGLCYSATSTRLSQSQLLEGRTVEGDTALHVVATYGDDDNFLKSADFLYGKAKQLLYDLNSNGDTPLHCAARAGKSRMVHRLIALARSGDDDGAGGMIRVKELVRKENGCKETALHEAVRNGSNHVVELLMAADFELACFPREAGTSPLYLAISLQHVDIAHALYHTSGGYLSYSGPNGQNALHAAALRSQEMTEMLLRWNIGLTTQGDQSGSTPLHVATAMLHPRGVHFLIFRPWFAWIRGAWHSTMPFYPVVQVLFHPWFPWNRRVWHSNTPFDPLLEANVTPIYQSDDKGLFPIHIAASIGANKAVAKFLEKCPNIAGVRDIKGRTFLHVAVKKKKWNIVAFACQTPSLSWILNMQDNKGNTALHLCIKHGSLDIFSLLLENQKVQLNPTNKKEETPLDLSQSNIRVGCFCGWNSRFLINAGLKYCDAKHGIRRLDHFEKEYGIQGVDEEKEAEKLAQSTQAMGLGAVLMATVAFSATFTLPGGYKDNGTPTLSGRYVFDAFIAANSLAFGCSGLATINLMYSGTALVDVPARSMHFDIAVFFAFCSVTSLATAFVLGLYLMLAPVAHMTATAICVVASAISLCGYIDPMRGLAVGRALLRRMGTRALLIFARILFLRTTMVFWPLVASFIWAAITTKYHHK